MRFRECSRFSMLLGDDEQRASRTPPTASVAAEAHYSASIAARVTPATRAACTDGRQPSEPQA